VITQFCAINYGVSFPVLAKVEVIGAGAHALWQALKAAKSGLLDIQSIKWNSPNS